MILVMSGETAEMLVSSRAERKGSSAQVDGFNFLMTASTSSCVTLEKELRGWTVSDSGSTVWWGETAVVERCERMLLTFCLKKVMCMLHLSSVASEWQGEGGLRRWLIVEDRCLELPGLLFMMVE